MKVAFATLGCRVNVYESEAMSEKFIKEGYEITDFDNFSDVYVINTCTVTNMGDKKSRQMIGRARRKNPNAIIAAVGCYSQVASKEVSLIEGVDVVLGTRNKSEVVYWVNRAREEQRQIVKVNDVLKNKVFDELNIDDYQNKTRAFLKVQDGCNRFCSYCLIPFARGAVCSKTPEKIIEEVKKLAQHNFKEIILSGIHMASYGVDLDKDVNLITVLEEINKIDGIERIRIGSIDPTFFTEEVIRKVALIEKMCSHFHLSMQSGSDETLKRMNRSYDSKTYRESVENLRKYMKNISITTDVIVGFPGETEEEFRTTYNFLKDIGLSKTHIFKFSPRTGTKAAEMPMQVEKSIKDIRSGLLIELNKLNEVRFMERFIGSEMYVLFEEGTILQKGYYEGYTQNYIKVIVKSEGNLKGKILKVKLNVVEEEHILGELI
ncbi:MAG: tRNA (N(6)-L-threonylcarbamoyladenosine(37)-C(2))-methylthiotransferase MtaB [Clostridium sp.]